jgi:hypothetical protein
MELRSLNARALQQIPPAVPCAQCGVTLFAPEWTEYPDQRHVRHLWSCTACGYCFECLVRYPAAAAQAA